MTAPVAARFWLQHAALGLLMGALAALGWRYAVQRIVIDTAPPPIPADKVGYMFVVKSLDWVNGPTWWPAFALLPAAGLAIGLIVGVLVERVARERNTRVRDAAAILGGGVIGALCGLAGAIYAHHDPPQVGIINTDTPRPPIDGNDLDRYPLIHGAPPLWELDPTYLTFPAMGTLIGLAIILIAAYVRHVIAARVADRSTFI